MGTPYHEFAFCGVGLKLDVDFCFLIDECWQVIEDGFENSLALYAFYTASRKNALTRDFGSNVIRLHLNMSGIV